MRRLAILVLLPLASSCGILDLCRTPDDVITEYAGQLGQTNPAADTSESAPGAVKIILVEILGPGTLDGATITVARAGLREFGDRLHVHDRRTGEMVLESDYGYYRSDSLVFRSHSYRDSGGNAWRHLKGAVTSGRAYFELHSRAGVDTAGLRLVRRTRQEGACT